MKSISKNAICKTANNSGKDRETVLFSFSICMVSDS